MKQFQSIQIMRSIAASMVVLYHFGYSNSNFLGVSDFWFALRYGDLGVWVFFVISGFVIAYAMHSTNYRVNDAWLPSCRPLERSHTRCISFIR
jgi:peptidoglycan/LPS O-acetylase OafA/YrhL